MDLCLSCTQVLHNFISCIGRKVSIINAFVIFQFGFYLKTCLLLQVILILWFSFSSGDFEGRCISSPYLCIDGITFSLWVRIRSRANLNQTDSNPDGVGYILRYVVSSDGGLKTWSCLETSFCWSRSRAWNSWSWSRSCALKVLVSLKAICQDHRDLKNSDLKNECSQNGKMPINKKSFFSCAFIAIDIVSNMFFIWTHYTGSLHLLTDFL